MSNTSNFRQAIRDARTQALVGPNVIANALPWVGGGLVLTAVGTFGGLKVIETNPGLFMPTFWGALILNLILFFVANGAAEKGNNSTALPLLATYSLLSGYTLSGWYLWRCRPKALALPGWDLQHWAVESRLLPLGKLAPICPIVTVWPLPRRCSWESLL